eukprot:4172210-Pyramimonas_sp.AAC.1
MCVRQPAWDNSRRSSNASDAKRSSQPKPAPVVQRPQYEAPAPPPPARHPVYPNTPSLDTSSQDSPSFMTRAPSTSSR